MIDLENALTVTSTNLHMSSPATRKDVMNFLEQESSGESTGGSTTEGGSKKFCSLADIYVDTLELKLDPDELVLLATESTTYHEATTETTWQEAMQKELEVIEKNKTWTLTNLPFIHKPMSFKWVFKIKKNCEENIIKHKERFVAKRYF